MDLSTAFESETGVALARLLESTISLERNQERTAAILEGMMAGLKDLRADVTDIENIVHERSRTQWSVIFGTVGAATTFLALVGGLVAYAWISDIQTVDEARKSDLAQTSQRIDRIELQLNNHTTKAGHPEGVVKQVEAVREAVKDSLDRVNERLDRYDDRISDLQKRTGTLFKEGKPY